MIEIGMKELSKIEGGRVAMDTGLVGAFFCSILEDEAWRRSSKRDKDESSSVGDPDPELPSL